MSRRDLQDADSGKKGDRFGRETAPKIAAALGAKLLNTRSNQCAYLDEQIVIKCAAKKTASVGVSKLMLNRISKIFAAFQNEDDSFEIISLAADDFKNNMRDTRSKGHSAGRVGIVNKKFFRERGQQERIIHI
jgi:hypothetical protein